LSLPLTRTQLFASFDFSQTQSNFAFEFVWLFMDYVLFRHDREYRRWEYCSD
jgi:hypothetical protein